MRNLNHVHLNGLKALEATGRLGSLKAAADELGVSVGAVSQQVIKAEAQLGKAVFERTGRGLAPTAFGRELIGRLTAGFQVLDGAVGLSHRHGDSILTISVAPVLASKWLVPRLADYSRRHPDIQVRLDATVRMVDVDTSDVDVALRVGDGNWPGVRTDFLLAQEVFPVAAPALARKLRKPRDLCRVPIVRDANSVLSWDVWLAPHGMREADLGEGHSCTDASLALDAAIAGQGVMLAWQTLAEYALTAGQLVAPFPGRAATGHAYYMVTSARRREPKKVRDFRAWMRAEMAATAAMFQDAPSGPGAAGRPGSD